MIRSVTNKCFVYRTVFFMIPVCFSLLLVLSPKILSAQVEPGENIIVNGRFDSDQMLVPPCWKLEKVRSDDICRCEASGGPEGIPCVTFSNHGSGLESFSLRQYEHELVPGGRYRFSAKVRTKGFSGRSFGVCMVNYGWKNEVRLGNMLSDQDWTEYSCEAVMFPSRPKNGYFASFYALDFKGEISVADVRLEAIDALAQSGTVKPSAGADVRLPRLVPIRPLLARIPSDKREITFAFFGRLPDKAPCEEFDVVVSASDTSVTSSVPLCTGETCVPLPQGGCSGTITVCLVRRTDGFEVLRNGYRYSVVDTPAQAVDSGRRLNNLVRELVSEKIAQNVAECNFSLAKDSWVFLALKKPCAKVLLDGVEVINEEALGGETFRRVDAGRHVVKVIGGKNAMLTVRKVPEIFNYPPCFNSHVLENGKYDWDFCERFVFPASAVQNAGYIPKDRRLLHKRRGGVWLASLGTSSIASADELYSLLSKSRGITASIYDGVTCDEQFFQKPGKLVHYTAGLKRFCLEDAGDRLVYSWAVGRPSSPGIDQEFFSACANASRGRGRVLSEIYCRPEKTEAAARVYLDEYIKGTLSALSGIYPGAYDSIGLILANFNQIPILSVHHYPEVDLKYFLDMQFHLIANDPAFDNLGCVGYWGSYYADREFLRWSMALLRHYCVEGRSEMLSGRYGYRYLPGHVVNGDFRDGLEGWTVFGDVRVDKVNGLGETLESRWYSGSIGDDFATLKKGKGATSQVAQDIKHLVPGRLYCLKCCMFDVKAVKKGEKCDRRVELDVSFDGATVLKDLSWRHIDRRTTGKKPNPAVNLEQIVFRADATVATLRISNNAAQEGSELGVNFISLCPYYQEGEKAP